MEYVTVASGESFMIVLGDGQKMEIIEHTDANGKKALGVRGPGPGIAIYPEVTNKVRIQTTED
jgi:hypothetical protein